VSIVDGQTSTAEPVVEEAASEKPTEDVNVDDAQGESEISFVQSVQAVQAESRKRTSPSMKKLTLSQEGPFVLVVAGFSRSLSKGKLDATCEE
jgi:hypothetical protein